MEFSLMTEPQLGGTYAEILAAARWAEEAGMASFARSDHYLWPGEPAPDATDAFATLAGLARETQRIRLCVLVTPITFRHPAVVAKNAATIDQMSGGRLDLGVGTGWMEAEHQAFGLPFWDWSERFSRFEEAIAYLKAAFGDGHGSFSGEHYRLDADVNPKPAGLRVLIGGSGSRRTPTLAGTHADEYNIQLTTAEDARAKIEVMRKAAEAAGRDPETVLVSMMGQVLVGADEADYSERLRAMAGRRGVEVDELEERLRSRGMPMGPPDRVGETLADLAEAGVERYYLQWLDITELEGLHRTWSALQEGIS